MSLVGYNQEHEKKQRVAATVRRLEGSKRKKGNPATEKWKTLKRELDNVDFSGAQGRNRTTDTRIFSPLLYRLSYLGKLPAGRKGRAF
jgi:hypothetical protein